MVTNLDEIFKIIIINPANILLEFSASIRLFKKWNTLYTWARIVFFREYFICVGGAPPVYTPVAGFNPGGGGDGGGGGDPSLNRFVIYNITKYCL